MFPGEKREGTGWSAFVGIYQERAGVCDAIAPRRLTSRVQTYQGETNVCYTP